MRSLKEKMDKIRKLISEVATEYAETFEELMGEEVTYMKYEQEIFFSGDKKNGRKG